MSLFVLILLLVGLAPVTSLTLAVLLGAMAVDAVAHIVQTP